MSTLSGIVHGLPEHDYHAHPALSSTGARMLLPEYKGSPKKYQWSLTHPRTSRTFDVGHAVHTKVLGVGAGFVEYPEEHLTPSGNPSTKAATVAWEEEQRAAGFTPVSVADARVINAMAEAVLAHPTAAPILEVAVHREVSVFSEIDGVPVRARFDALSDETRNGVYGVDLKTTDDATKVGAERSVTKWGYDFQDAWYDDVHRAATGHPVDQFFFINVEKSGPYEVAVMCLPDLWRQMGKTKAAEARRVYRECVESGEWPGYTTEIQFLDPPAWAVIDHEMRYESGEIEL
jgi:exodeoxyribonuclease VIII